MVTGNGSCVKDFTLLCGVKEPFTGSLQQIKGIKLQQFSLLCEFSHIRCSWDFHPTRAISGYTTFIPFFATPASLCQPHTVHKFSFCALFYQFTKKLEHFLNLENFLNFQKTWISTKIWKTDIPAQLHRCQTCQLLGVTTLYTPANDHVAEF